MKMPIVLMLLSLAGVGLGFLPGMSDVLLLAAPCLLASLYLVGRAFWGKRAARRGGLTPQNWILVDGSNVLHWANGPPDLTSLRRVVDHLTEVGFVPGVVLDANAGYKIGSTYQHHADFGRLLGLPEDRVMVVAKGSPADVTLLEAARDLGARIVTNDRFRDWAEAYPEVATPGHLVRGGFDGAKLWLDLGTVAKD